MLNNNRKAEIIYIPIGCLLLDNNNPRLAGDDERSEQEEIIQKIYDNEELEELAGSLALHGFLPEEPIIVFPKVAGFDDINPANAQNFEYIVLEGNRRITTVKLLLDSSLRNRIQVDDSFPAIEGDDVRDNLLKIPTIIYRERKDVDAYLGIRHISGNRKWDAYAKAKYIYDKVEECKARDGMTVNESIEYLKHQIADRKDTIRKLYVYYKIFAVIEADIVSYNSKHIKERFSLIQVALGTGRTPISDYIGVPPFSSIDLESEIIDSGHFENLKDITRWIFGLKDGDSG